MIVIYEFDEPIVCPHCSGVGEIRLDLYDFLDVTVDRHRTIMCGYCEGYGYVETEILFDPDFEVRPEEPDST